MVKTAISNVLCYTTQHMQLYIHCSFENQFKFYIANITDSQILIQFVVNVCRWENEFRFFEQSAYWTRVLTNSFCHTSVANVQHYYSS